MLDAIILHYLHILARVTIPDCFIGKSADKMSKSSTAFENLLSNLCEGCSEPLLCQTVDRKFASVTFL